MQWKETDYAGWGRVHKAEGRMARPERLSALTALAADSPSPAIGNCRSYGDACLNGSGGVIDMTRMDRVLSFDAKTGVAEVEAGLTIGDMARIFTPKGWIPAVMPGTGIATVGGCIGHDVHGKSHHHAGSFGQHVLSMNLLQGDKRVIVTPKRNKALFRATMGGCGQTGVIVSAKIQLAPCPGNVMQVRERRAENWDAFIAMLDASTGTYTVGWIDGTARGAALGRGIFEEGEVIHGDLGRDSGTKSVPMNAPGFALSSPVVKAFNAAYFRRVPAQGRTVIKPIEEFFFPLDKIHDWNRLYGKRGFYQFQAVVPLDQSDALRAMLEKVANAGLASPLAVLKRMGPGRAGHMSFPMEGYTLAIDIPNRGKADALMIELEAMTVEAGGRLYLAKDTTAPAPMIKAMYPEHADWCEVVAKADPTGTMETDLVRRLDLRRPL